MLTGVVLFGYLLLIGLVSAKEQPKLITISALLHKMSRAQFDTLIAEKPFSDSTIAISTSRTVHHILYLPVNFEGQQSKLSAVVSDDSVSLYTITIPRRGRVTPDDFMKLRKIITEEIGDPSVYTDLYIDYMKEGKQPVFGTYKDGYIFITVVPS